MRKRLTSAVIIMLLLCLTQGAWAGEYELDAQGVRYLSQDGQTVITPATAADYAEELSALGTSPEVYAASMNGRGESLRIRTAEGDEIALTITAAPEALAGYDAFDHGADGQAGLTAWAAENWPDAQVAAAAFSSYFVEVDETQRADPMTIARCTLLTVHYGYLYELSIEAYGEGVLPFQHKAVEQAALSLLFLGEEREASVAYPEVEVPAPSAEKAEVSITADATPLAVDAPPATLYQKTLTLTGTTTPNTDMRYYIGNTGYDRFVSDENGAWSVTITDLAKGRNRLRVQAIGAGGYGTAALTVTVKIVACPVAVMETNAVTSDDHYLLAGRTAPGATVKLYLRKDVTEAEVAADGTFAIDVPLPKEGKFSYTLRATGESYNKTDLHLTITRDAAAASLGAAPTDEMLRAPVKDTVLRVTGEVVALLCPDGQPVAVLRPEGCEQLVAVRMGSIAPFHLGQTGSVTCRLTGETIQVAQAGLCALAEQ